MKISEILYKEFKHAPTLSEFVDVMHKVCDTPALRWQKTFAYCQFLKQPIELKMLVPCKDGEVLESPRYSMTGYNHKYKEYQKAKEEVLFSGDWGILGKYVTRGGEDYIEIELEDIGEDDGCVKIGSLIGQPITENYFKFLD